VWRQQKEPERGVADAMAGNEGNNREEKGSELLRCGGFHGGRAHVGMGIWDSSGCLYTSAGAEALWASIKKDVSV
jgi:hypothetical protein